ncbi:hypothetical protein [Streptomyces sp. NRRL B-24484]|uniref:hypothetical protein n=1 Tax=Streptomyces sp. NRRL B-24484 TaxID=1463833 RepID=UPI0004C225B6|nr:hypothetical protein [Streptomyces sp. NRRL B-24484]
MTIPSQPGTDEPGTHEPGTNEPGGTSGRRGRTAVRATTRAAARRLREHTASRPTRPAEAAAAVAGVVLAVVIAGGALYWLVRFLVWIIAGAFHGTAGFAGGLWHSATADHARTAAKSFTAVVTGPAASWLHQHTTGLPVTAHQLAVAWTLLAAIAFVSARGGSPAGRLVWAFVGAGTATAVWQASPDGQRAAATATTAGLWLLLTLSAYRPRPTCTTTSTRTELIVSPLLERALTAALERATSTTAPTAAGAWAGDEQVEPLPQPATPAPPPVDLLPAAAGFQCRHYSRSLRWATGQEPGDRTRTWRTADDSTTCPTAPDGLHYAL